MYSGTSSTRSNAECSFIAFWDIQQTTNEACNGGGAGVSPTFSARDITGSRSHGFSNSQLK